MFKNYLKIAWRNFLRSKIYSFINIIGLATGMAVAGMIGLWIWDEISFDNYHQNHSRLAQVMDSRTYDGETTTGTEVVVPLAEELRLKKVDNAVNLKVAGIYQDPPINSSFHDTKFLLPWYNPAYGANQLLSALAFFVAHPSIAQPAAAQPSIAQPSDSAIVSQLNQKWIASYATHDTAAIQQILADDFIIVVPNGKKMDRLSVIRNVGATDVSTTATIDSSSVRVFGNAALVVSYTHFSITANGQTSHGKNCYSDLYIKRKGEWKAVSGHVTML